MLLETEKESICINKKVGQKKEEIVIEGDVIVNDIKPDVLSIISNSGIPCVYKKEVMDGKIRLDGSIKKFRMQSPLARQIKPKRTFSSFFCWMYVANLRFWVCYYVFYLV